MFKRGRFRIVGATLATFAIALGAFTVPAVTGGPVTCAISTTNVPDGPDPWGGCWPGPSNTGPTGTLTAYTGSCTLSTNNVTIDSKIINCDLDVRATGIVISNSEMHGQITHTEADTDRGTVKNVITVTDTYIDGGLVPQSTSDGRGIEDRNFTAIRVEFDRGRSSSFCQYYCLIKDSYAHGQDTDETGVAHESGIRIGSGTTTHAQELLHNSISCQGGDVLPDGGCSAAISGYGDFDVIQNNYVYRNLIMSSSWPGDPVGSVGFCAYGGSSGSKPFPHGANNAFTENVFQRGNSGKCGVFGPTSSFEAGVNGNTFTGNTWDDGSTPGPTADG
jgi:hypothetical protein